MNDLNSTIQPSKKEPVVLALLDNLFFAAKINQAAQQVGLKAAFAKKSEQAWEMARFERPRLIIVDLDEGKCSPLDLIKWMKADEEMRHVPTLGFVSHVNTSIQQQAREAGCDRVIARSAFDKNLVALLIESGSPGV
jgi:PleD family two-component response regulator